MEYLAVEYLRDGNFKNRTYEPSAPASGEVQIAVAYTGICGTDLTISHGGMDGRFTDAWPIGHEMSGTIAVVGENVGDWAVGDKVTVMPLDWCGDCPACNAGHKHICHNLNFVGIDSPGSLQERWNVKAELLVPLPGEMSLRDAALVEPTAVAVHDVNRANVSPGNRVVVIGGGPIGILIALISRSRGAEVLVSEVSAFRQNLAREFGFTVVNPVESDLATEVAAWTDDRGADIAFEVSGTEAGLRSLTSVLAARGTAVIVGIFPKPAPVDLFRVFWRELTILGARVYERADFETAISLLADGTIPADKLITDVMPLSEGPAAIERLSSGEDIVKLLVTPLS